MVLASLRPGGALADRRAPAARRGQRLRLLALLAVLAAGWGARGCGRAAQPWRPVLYLSDRAGGVGVAVDPLAGQVVARIPVGKRPRGLALSRDGHRLFVALSGSPRGGPGVDESKLP